MLQIRGKRKRKSESHEKGPGRTRHLALKRQQKSSSQEKAIAMHRIQRHHLRSRDKTESSPVDNMSLLERLPVELIQEIFFYALEMDMPYASKYLRQVLSTQPIFEALTVFAYFDDDGLSPVETKHFLPAEYRPLTLTEKVYLQQSILSSSWCTFQHIKSCLHKLARSMIFQAWHREHYSEESLYESFPKDQEPVIKVVNEAIRPFAKLPELEDEAGLQEHFVAPTLIEDLGSSPPTLVRRGVFDARQIRIVTWTSILDKEGITHKTIFHPLSIFAARHIPSWLLRSVAWSQERLEFLQLLRQGFTWIEDDLVMSISARAVFEGMKNSLQEHNKEALKTLLEIHNSFFRNDDWVPDHTHHPLIPPSHHPIPSELFRLAVEQGDSAASLLSLLLRAGIDSLPKDDPKITAWALHQSTKGSVIATWLLKHMEDTSNYGIPSARYLFTNGAVSWRVAMAEGRLFPATSFAEELGYIRGLVERPVGLNGKVCGED